jgi:hypothetical protein
MRFTFPAKLASFALLESFCSCTSTKLPNTQTAAEQFSVLGSREKIIARNFYDLGSGDAIKRLYWAQRRVQETGGVTESQPATGLQRKYVLLPVPEHVEPDGTIKEATSQVVEVVQ